MVWIGAWYEQSCTLVRQMGLLRKLLQLLNKTESGSSYTGYWEQ